MQEQELFQSYEVKNWDFNPRIYKILAASAVFNILALFVVGQTNLLTTKGCDSPLVGGVCQVLDTLYVSGTVLATDTRTIDDPESGKLPEDAEIIWVDRTGDDDFKYPEGYFALSNPEMMIPQEIPNADGSFPTSIPGIPNPTTAGGGTNDLMSQPQVLPQPNDNAVNGSLPSSPFTYDNPTNPKQNKVRPYRPQKTPKIKQDSPNKLPDLNSNQTANTENKDPKNPDENKVEEVVINKAPLKSLAADVKTKVKNNELDLSQNFKVVAEGIISKDGKLLINTDKKTKKPIFVAEGNEKMVEVVTTAIAAVGNSGWLGYLRQQNIEKVNFTVVQDNDNLQVIITSDLATPERANTVTSGFNGVIQAAFFADKNNIKKLGEDEKVLLSNAKVLVNPDNKKQFVLNFVLPKQTAQEMITRKLNEPEEKPTETKPNGSTAQIKENRQNTAK
jgi:hypothetical protein